METILDDNLLDANQVSELTGLHPGTVRRLAWQRRIRSFKVLGALRFKRSDVEKIIQERPAKDQVGASAA